MINETLIDRLKGYITEHYKLRGEYPVESAGLFAVSKLAMLHHAKVRGSARHSLETLSHNLGESVELKRSKTTFSVLLDKLREERGLTAPQLYERAWIDRRLYSKIIGKRRYHPEKTTIIQFGIALKLNESGMADLLESAGYVLNDSSIVDLIIKFCIENKVYDIADVNALMLTQGQKVLCGEL
ncbi:hypothetical protein AGMMS50212_13630 [Spirochaetia bacterium]|nr:hypothetical protein AGMMS50212_13630 [Spirochaetia bacterium]